MTSSLKSTEMIELSSADKEAVLFQIERLLLSPHFKNSRRYTDLLRYVVQQTLEGHADILKERTLGIEVFGREPSFDTAGDSIVRVAAAEVRKRLALYYQEEGHENELRVDLPSGSYVAHFRLPPKPGRATAAESEARAPIHIDQTAPATQEGRGSSRWLKLGIAAGVFLAVIIAGLAGIRYMGMPGEQKDLLAPVWKSPQDVILCVGTPSLAHNQPGADDSIEKALGQPATNNTLLPFADAMTLSGFQILLNNHHKAHRVQLARTTAFSDLRAGPVILIGALDNPWTLRLTSKLRFHFSGTDEWVGEIVDSNAKQAGRWSVDFHVPYSDRTQDYAIAAILHDDTLDQPLLIAAGIGPNGTMAAGEFLMNRGDLGALARMAPAHWSGKNVEVVLATQVIQGNSGPPRIIAAEYW